MHMTVETPSLASDCGFSLLCHRRVYEQFTGHLLTEPTIEPKNIYLRIVTAIFGFNNYVPRYARSFEGAEWVARNKRDFFFTGRG